MESPKIQNNYPTVFVHGFLGMGYEAGLTSVYRYFGSFTKDLMKHLTRKGYEVYQPTVGAFSPLWNRCCDLYAYLYGGTADYGKVHSKRYHQNRYGRTYPGVLKDWGEEGDHKKINIIGHSFGGPTVTMFAGILEKGCQEELDATPADEVSDFFKGGKGHLLHTVTTLSGVNAGTSAADFGVKYHLMGLSSKLSAGLVSVLSKTQITKFLDFHMEAWDLMEEPSKVDTRKLSLPDFSAIKKYANNREGNIYYEMHPEITRKLLIDYKPNPHTYYFARRACRTHEGPGGRQYPDTNINPMFAVTALILGRYKNKKLGIDDSWLASDGIVNVAGMGAPYGHPSMEWIPGMEFKPGIWHEMPVEDKDHQSFAGMWYFRNRYYLYYDAMLHMLHTLPDA